MNKSRAAFAFGIAVALGVPGAAFAQAYKWRDQNGVTVYSDSPPPASIPPGNVLQAPKLKAASAPTAPPPAAAQGESANPKAGTISRKLQTKSVAEREADYKKRQIEEQKKAKEQGEKTAQEEQRQAQCQSLAQNLATLESGQRMAKVDSKGERYFVDDAERAKDVAKARQDIAAAKCS
jgi:hypothetical protein